jgi:nucleotidyltransferase/DNA polymerase involved in DNA repair
MKSHQMKYSSWVNRFKEIYSLAVKLFDELRDGSEINLVGLSISGLKDEKVKQKPIFSFV